MKICVIGAGAIGGLLGARLADAGHSVSLVARGQHLAAIQQHGMKLLRHDAQTIVKNVTATDDIAELKVQDVVLLALKSHQIAAVVAQLPRLLGKESVMVTLQNGIPWWYFQQGQSEKSHEQKSQSEYSGRTITAVDPGGVLADTIDPAFILGCVAYPAAVITEPGVIRHIEGFGFPLGELDGSDSERANRIAQLFIAAGFKSWVLDDIRAEIWLKLWGNLCINPISALTHATMDRICQFPLSRQLAEAMMIEAQKVAEKLGVSFRVTMERRLQGAEKVGKHKTSMLQDAEAGKALEIDAMLSAVIELAELTHTEVPALRSIHACVSLLNDTIMTEQVSIKSQSLV